jgi:hypothetical protein
MTKVNMEYCKPWVIMSPKSNFTTKIAKELSMRSIRCAHFPVSLLLAAVLAGCNSNNTDAAAPDTSKPTLTLSNPLLVTGVVLAAPSSGTAVGFTIADTGRVLAADNSGSYTLSLVQAVGLATNQLTLDATGKLTAHDILPSNAIGRGHAVIRATDAAGNYADTTVYFDISPAPVAVTGSVTQGQALELRFPISDAVVSATISLPSAPAGVTGTAVLIGHEVVVTLNTTIVAAAGTLAPELRLLDADGKTLAITLSVQVHVADPAPVAAAGSAFAGLGDMTVSDEYGAIPITTINTGGVTDPLSRQIVYSATGLPVGLVIDSGTGQISGVYDAGSVGDASPVDSFSVTVQAQAVGSAQKLQKSFVLSIRNDG